MLNNDNHLPVSDFFNQPKNTIPFYVEHSDFKVNKIIEISLLHPNQWTIDSECLKRKIKSKKTHSVVFVAFIKGIYVLIDGHHTVIAKSKSGQTKVKCRLAIIN